MNVPAPLEQVMTQFGLSNNDLVRASTEQLTHKMVRKGRKGKHLTENVRNKIFNALRAARPDSAFQMKDLFND
ncbi:MAG: hypothetical protein PHN49_06850 [Candidatus Omnitrophica bacterium]|nr:hypothetical protein [Candidatus Omnitrophota bacterium]MDD5671337.1 hypothetical protein [Candidatus Omnitrophota bacterium]